MKKDNHLQLLTILTFIFFTSISSAQNFKTATELKNAIDMYIDLGYKLNNCKNRCDFDYCNRVFTTWYSAEPKDYYYQRENDIGNAWEESKKSSFKSSTCNCSEYEKPNLNLSTNSQPTKLQKQADAVNKLNDLFNILVNPKKN